MEERLREEAEPADDERPADDAALQVEGVLAELRPDPVAEQRERRGAGEHPEREVRVDGAEPAMRAPRRTT